MQFVAERLGGFGYADQFVDVGRREAALQSAVVLAEEHGGDHQPLRMEQVH
jgi:hypothetical protein